MRRWSNVDLLLGQRCKRWSNRIQALGQGVMVTGSEHAYFNGPYLFYPMNLVENMAWVHLETKFLISYFIQPCQK